MNEWVNDDDDNNNNNYNNNYSTGLPHAQGYYDDDDRYTDEGMHRIKPGHSFCLLPILDYYGRYFDNNNNNNNNNVYFHYLSTGHEALIAEGSSARQDQLR